MCLPMTTMTNGHKAAEMHDIEKKTGRGRPPLEEGKRRVQVMVSLRQQDVDAINRIADEKGITRSEYVRLVLLDAIKKEL